MPKYGPVSIKLPVELDRSDTELMAALKGEKGDKGDSVKGDKGDSVRGADSTVPGPKGDKGDSIEGPRGPKGDDSAVFGPKGDKGDLPSDEHVMDLIRKVMKGL